MSDETEAAETPTPTDPEHAKSRACLAYDLDDNPLYTPLIELIAEWSGIDRDAKARSALRRAIDETDDARARSAAVDRQMTTRRVDLAAAERVEAETFDDLVKAIAAKRLGAQP